MKEKRNTIELMKSNKKHAPQNGERVSYVK